MWKMFFSLRKFAICLRILIFELTKNRFLKIHYVKLSKKNLNFENNETVVTIYVLM